MEFKKSYSFEHIGLVSRVVSELKSRKEAVTSTEIFGTTINMPIISSPMIDVCDGKMAAKLYDLGCLGIIHRFQSIEEQIKEYNDNIFSEESERFEIPKFSYERKIVCAIGVTDDYQERFKELYKAGCKIFCLDTANGMNKLVEEAVKWIRNFEKQNEESEQFESKEIELSFRNKNKIYLIAGNVVSAEGYEYLSNLGVDAVRCGIGNGTNCITRIETGIYQHPVSVLLECVEMKESLAYNNCKKDYKNFAKLGIPLVEAINYTKSSEEFKQECNKLPKIILDGGIHQPQDLCKAIALGADLCMIGSLFAATKEAPSEKLKIDGKIKCIYRGAASYSSQKEHRDEKPYFIEGRESLLDLTGSIEDVIKRFKAGLQSSMSYMNSKDLKSFRENCNFVELL